MSDYYTVTVTTPGQWPSSEPMVEGPILNWQRSHLSVTVNVPYVPEGDSDVMIVTVTSQGDPSQTAEVRVNTIAQWYYIYMPIIRKYQK